MIEVAHQNHSTQLRRYKGTTDLQLERISVYYVSDPSKSLVCLHWHALLTHHPTLIDS
jgi:hypothetical protein